MIGAVATGLTFLRNFKLPCLYVALAASLVAGFASYRVTRAVMDGRVARAETDLQAYRADVLRETLSNTAAVAGMQKASADATAAAIGKAVDVLSGKIALANDKAAIQQVLTAIEELRNDPTFTCRQLPLPDRYVDSLRLPAE